MDAYTSERDYHMGYEPLHLPLNLEPAGPALTWLQGKLVEARVVVTEGPSCATFRLDIGGQPHPLAMTGACILTGYEPRTIRHSVSARLCCDGTASSDITGTAFPSHRAFLSGEPTVTRTQGTLDELLKIDNPGWIPMADSAWYSRDCSVCDTIAGYVICQFSKVNGLFP